MIPGLPGSPGGPGSPGAPGSPSAPGGGGTPASALAPDERLRQLGVKLMTAISATLRVGRAYNIQNQVFQHQIDTLFETVQPAFQQADEAVLVVHEADLYFNGVRVPVNKASFKFQQTVIEMFQRLDLSGIRFTPEVATQDLTRLWDLFLKVDGPTGQALLTAVGALSVQGVAPIVHATVDPSGLRAGGEMRVPTAEDERVANQIFEPRIEALEISGRKRQAQAVASARLVLMPTSLQTGLEMRHAKRVVQPLVEGVSLSEPIVVGLSALSQHDEYTYAHAVNVCGVAVAIGHFLGLDRRALSDLGVAALLHDVGKQAVAGDITHDLEEFTPEEKAAAERHTIEGSKLLARSTALNPTTLNCLRVTLEHHATGRDGYPRLPSGWKVGILSQVVAVADCFISLQSRLSRVASAVSPTEALGMMLGPLAERFDPALLWALVRAVGFYPAGQVVEMDDGTIATVLAPNADDPGRPHVRIVLTPAGIKIKPEEQRELRPVPADRSVRRALKVSEYPEGVVVTIDADRDEGQREAAA